MERSYTPRSRALAFGSRWLPLGAALSLLVIALPGSLTAQQAPAPAAPAEAPAAAAPAATPVDQEAVDRGRRWFRDRANCAYCHGWNGEGSLVEGEPPAPPLTTTELDHDGLIEVIACGRISKTMPTHLREAWRPEYPCYGLTRADMKPEEMPRAPFASLSKEQIDDVVAYVEAVYQGKPMTYENCVAWFQRDAPQCQQYKK